MRRAAGDNAKQSNDRGDVIFTTIAAEKVAQRTPVMFSTIVIDPPWMYDDRLVSGAARESSARARRTRHGVRIVDRPEIERIAKERAAARR